MTKLEKGSCCEANKQFIAPLPISKTTDEEKEAEFRKKNHTMVVRELEKAINSHNGLSPFFKSSITLCKISAYLFWHIQQFRRIEFLSLGLGNRFSFFLIRIN